jgi:hypothetical protein
VARLLDACEVWNEFVARLAVLAHDQGARGAGRHRLKGKSSVNVQTPPKCRRRERRSRGDAEHTQTHTTHEPCVPGRHGAQWSRTERTHTAARPHRARATTHVTHPSLASGSGITGSHAAPPARRHPPDPFLVCPALLPLPVGAAAPMRPNFYTLPPTAPHRTDLRSAEQRSPRTATNTHTLTSALSLLASASERLNNTRVDHHAHVSPRIPHPQDRSRRLLSGIRGESAAVRPPFTPAPLTTYRTTPRVS